MPSRLSFLRYCLVHALSTAAVMIPVVTASAAVHAQSQPLTIFKNYFVTGDYVVAGWNEGAPDGSGFASGTISVPDTRQINALGGVVASGVQTTVPKGADIVAAYLYWATVEGSQSSYAGQQGSFNGYKIVGNVLGNPNAPTSWSSGGCSGSSNGSKTMRFYRADVRPYLPLDVNPNSTTFGAIDVTNAGNPIPVRLADSGSNGNTAPFALGASLVIVYRLTSSPAVPLNAIVLYDGSYAPSNGASTINQSLSGFYQPGVPPSASRPVAKLTNIVANGQPNKSEQVYLNSTAQPLPSLYGSAPAFPGIYNQNGSAWDNPTWVLNQYPNQYVSTSDTLESTTVVPSSSNSGCVNWGAMVLSTTVQDSDHDGLLDVWEQNQGYTDAVSGQPVSLPNANPNAPDIYVELDYFTLRDSSGNLLHSHLPKKDALDAVGNAFGAQGIHVHFDLPQGVYGGDPYVISTSGSNEISESSLICTDGATLCAFPNQAAVSWKGGFESVKNDPTLGNFQPGRAQSYRYALFGHSLGEPRSYWGTAGSLFAATDPSGFAYSMPQLVSIAESGNTATVTIKSPTLIANGVLPQVSPLVLKPGNCATLPSPLPAACSDANVGRVTISGSLVPAQYTAGTLPTSFPLNGTYTYSNATSSAPDANGMITTTFQVVTSGVANGTYQFSCPSGSTVCFAEPQLGVSYLGPTSSSGHADFSGGGDLAVTLGLWRADDASGCVADPSSQGSPLCNDQVGTLNVQAGTLMHEMGHTLTLTHGGTYYSGNVPTYDLNCKPNFISVMNYLFQVRGFVDGSVTAQPPFNKFDFSGQTLPALSESSLNEATGVGLDGGQPATHLTRWYSAPNAADLKVGSFAKANCDGTVLIQGEAPVVRVDGTLPLPSGGTFSGPLDWNNDLFAGDAVAAPGEDLNHNGVIDSAPFNGFDDWQVLTDVQGSALQQINARSSGFGFSEGGGLKAAGGGGLKAAGGGGVDSEGGGLKAAGGGGLKAAGGGGLKAAGGGGIEQDIDAETANSTVGAPNNLTCPSSLTQNGTVFSGCTVISTGYFEKGKAVPLTWSAPDFGQIRFYNVWRAVGSFPTVSSVAANISKFSNITQNSPIAGAPPTPQYVDGNVKTNTTYTYFVTDTNSQGANSGMSAPIVVSVKF